MWNFAVLAKMDHHRGTHDHQADIMQCDQPVSTDRDQEELHRSLRALTGRQISHITVVMKEWHGNESEDQYLPGVGVWVASITLPLTVTFVLGMMMMSLGDGGGRMLSVIKQISNARSELLPMLVGSQLGVSSLVIAVTQFQPGRWHRTPRELGDCWLIKARRIASQENRFIACSFGLIGISSVIVFGVAACISQRIDAAGILLLMIVWGVHAVSSLALIMIPNTGVVAITDYWNSLNRLSYIAEVWPEELKLAKKKAEGKGFSLSANLKQWRGIAVLTSLLAALAAAALVGKLYFGASRWLLLQFGAGDMVVAATLLSIGAGYTRWSPVKYFRIVYWLSWPLMLFQGFILELKFIAITISPSLARNLSIVSVGVAIFLLVIPLSMIASGSRILWSRLDFLKVSLVSIWVSDLRLQRRCGLKCTAEEREAIERFVIKTAKRKKKGLAKIVRRSVLLSFSYGQ